MKKGWIWGIGLVLGVPLTLAVAAAIVVSTMDEQVLLNQAASVVDSQYGRKLQFEGPAQLRWFPSVGIDLSKVSLSEPNQTKPFLQANSVGVSFAVLPLLRSTVKVDAIEADGVVLNVVKDAQGEFNFKDFQGGGVQGSEGEVAEPPETPESTEPGQASGQPLDFSVESIELSHLNLSYRDLATGLDASLNDFFFASGLLKSGEPTVVSLEGRIKANKPALDVKVDLVSKLVFELDHGVSVNLTGLESEIRGQLDGQEALVSLQAKQLAVNPSTLEVLLADLAAEIDAAVPGVGQVQVTLTSPNLQIGAERAEGETLNLKAKLVQAQQTLDAEVTLALLQGSLNQGLSANIDLSVFLESPDRQLGLGLASVLKASSLQTTGSKPAGPVFALSQFEGDLNVTDAALPGGKVNMPLTGQLQADLGAQKVDLKLASEFKSTQFDLNAAVNDFAKPFIKANLNAGRLDLDALFPPATEQPASEGQAPSESSPNDIPVDLSPLKQVNADINAKLDSIRVSGVVASNVSLRAQLNNGKLTVSPLQADLYQGNATGRLVANANTNSFAVNQQLSGIQVEPLLKGVANKDMLAGRGDVNVQLTTRGKTLGELKAVLDGEVGVSLVDGAVKGFNLAESLRGAKSLLSGKANDQASQADANKKTDFTSFKVSFQIQDGVAKSNDLELMAPLFRIGGEGYANLLENKLDYTASAAIVATSTGQGGKTFDDGLSGLTVPVRLFGEFSAIQWKVLLADLAKAAVKARAEAEVKKQKEALKSKVEEKKDEFKSQVQDQLQDKLKGLFGR